MDSGGTVIGISVATFQSGQNLNLAVPVSYLLKLIAAQSKDASPLGKPKISDQPTKSMLDSIGTRTETGLTVSDYHLGVGDYGKYSFRLTNKLPVEISGPKLLILYYDASGSLMDFEDYTFAGRIPAGLTKTVANDFGSEESKRAADYYGSNNLTPKIEIRVVTFHEESSE